MKKIYLLLLLSLSLSLSSLSQAATLNIPAGSNGGRICSVTQTLDDQTVIGSLRRALNQGYNNRVPGLPELCAEKIVFDLSGTIRLSGSIILNQTTSTGFTLEKSASIPAPLFLDASGLPAGSCAITISASQITLRRITILGGSTVAGICLEASANNVNIDNVTVIGSGQGVWVKNGARRNTIQNSFFYSNRNFGVKLDDASQNRVTQNTIHSNGSGPLSSPATSIQPALTSAAPINETNTQFSISGTVPNAVERIEIYKTVPTGSNTNFIGFIDNTNPDFQGLNFILNPISANSGDTLFALAIAADGTTSAVSSNLLLSSIGSGSTTTGPVCVPLHAPYSLRIDSDHDGLPDAVEDLNRNCIVDVGETDPNNADTDRDGIIDGYEDRNHNGIVDEGESNPTRIDTDGDRIPDGIEDRNHNGILDSDESDPTKADTDGDGISDYIEDFNHNGTCDCEDANHNGACDANEVFLETCAYLTDTDRDGISDGTEDANHNGVVDMLETDPRLTDTDGDGLLDNVDACPRNPSLICQRPCVVGQTPAENLDSDRDGVPDAAEDANHNCVMDAGETNPYLQDTDGDGLIDSADSCPRNIDTACTSTCVPRGYVPVDRDSDADGLPDVQEDRNGNCVLDPNESNPFDRDTDDDGIPDNLDRCPQDTNPLCNSMCVPGQTPAETVDSDGDSIADRYEDLNHNCVRDGNESDARQRDTDRDGLFDNQDACPNNPDLSCASSCIRGEFVPPTRDSDNDGIPDVLEDVNNNCLRDVSESNAFNNDTDDDGISDGIEDKNHNGQVDAGETDPRNPDSDADGINDGLEDRNHNGIRDFAELNPTKTDTDDDGVPDRLEDTNLNGQVDRGETHGALADTDQDGIKDGDEDKNHNGRVDAGETDPRNADSDGDGAGDGQELAQGTNPIHASEGDLRQAMGQGCALTPLIEFSSFGLSTLFLSPLLLVGIRLTRRK